jgi:putative ABC transport system ATP-binding protein
MINVEDVFIVFFSGTPRERVAVRGINFSANEGEIVSILGDNGSGKSTLLRFLAGHILSSFGRLCVNKVDITAQSLSDRAKIFSTVFYDETTGPAENLTIAENMAIAGMHHQPMSMFSSAIDSEMREIFYQQLKELDFMGMEALLDEKVCNISKAQRHILSMLLAIIKEAKVLLIDEHSTGLDKKSSEELLAATEKIIRAKKITTIMAINDPKFAMDISDKILVLSHGQLVAELTADAKKKTKLHEILASYNIMSNIKDSSNRQRH